MSSVALFSQRLEKIERNNNPVVNGSDVYGVVERTTVMAYDAIF